MRPRPDPLQRLALLRHDGRTAVVDVPASPIKGDEEPAGPDVAIAARADPVTDGDDFRPNAESPGRRRIAEGSPPMPASGPTEPERDLVMGPQDPALPADESVVMRQGFSLASRVPGQHRQPEEAAPSQVEIAEIPPSDSDVQGVEAFSAFGGWVPDDDRDEWGGFDSPDPQVRHPVQPERRAPSRHRAATGDDVVVDEPEGVNGHSSMDLEKAGHAQRDDSGRDGGIRPEADRADRDGDEGDGDEGDGDEGDGDERHGDELADSDQPEAPRIRAQRLGNRPWGRLAELWVPESLREARIDPGRRGLLVLLLVAAVAAVATAIGVWRDRPEPRPVETVALTPASGVTGLAALAPVVNTAESPMSGAVVTAGAASASASTAPPTEIVVSVTGLVVHPGAFTLPVGARVTDAITAAGGSTADADLTGLNLAAKLADGDSVVIAATAGGAGSSGVSGTGSAPSPSPGHPGASPGQQTLSQLIDLNTADVAALDSLPGVGPVMAQNILAWRAQNGRFSSVEQLQEINGIGPARYAQISALVTVS